MQLKYRIILFLLIFIWFTGIFLDFLIEDNSGLNLLSFYLENIYSKVCHVVPAKLICLNGNCSQVCSRCTGIYAGALISSIVSIPFSKIKLENNKILYSAVLAMLFDVIFYHAGLYNYNKYSAFFTGLLFGCIGFLYIRSALDKLIKEIN